MDQQSTPYAQVLAGIRGQLTGDPERDLPFLHQQAERHRNEPWARPFLRELGRLFYDLMPSEQRQELSQALESDMERLGEMRRQAWEHLEAGRLDEAQRLADELLQAVRSVGEADLDGTYMDFADPLEETYYRSFRDGSQAVRRAPVSHQPALVLQARLHMLREEYQQALQVLDHAVSRAPASARPRLLRLEVRRHMGQVDRTLEEAREALPLCHESDQLAQVYRLLGWCLAESGRREAALAARLVSLHHDWHPGTLAELTRALDAPDGPEPDECARRAAEVLGAEGIPLGPDPLWLQAARDLQGQSRHQDEESSTRISQTLAALQAPLDLPALLRRYQAERVRPSADADLQSTLGGRYLRTLQESLLGWFSRAQAQEANELLQDELRQAEEAGNQPFWASEWSGVEAGRDLLFGQPILAEMGRQVLEAAARTNMPAGPAVAWGVLPVPGQGGRVLVAPEGERVPVVFAGSLLFAHLLAKVLASSLPVDRAHGQEGLGFDRTGIENRLRDGQEVHRRFVELVVASARGNPGLAPPWILGGGAGHLAALLCESAELFLLAEQFSLAAQEPAGSRREALPGGVQADRLLFEQQPQVQAVAVAMQLAGSIQEDGSLGFDLCLAAIAAHLSGLSLVEQLSGTSDGDGQLNARFRSLVILELLRQHVPSASKLAENLLHALELLWQHNGAIIMERLGVEPGSSTRGH